MSRQVIRKVMKKCPIETHPPATLADVARTAGVSITTADRVRNGRVNWRSRSAQQVLQAADGLRYRPSDTLAAKLACRLCRLGVLMQLPGARAP
jgi:DNA-binding LacI/PurR family transcriptional regulator